MLFSLLLVPHSLFSQGGSSQVSADAFVGNVGQWSNEARFSVTNGRMQAWFVDGGVRYELSGRNGARHVLDWSIVNGKNAVPQGVERENAYRSWIIGQEVYDNAPGYSELVYRDIYPGVDAHYQLHGGTLKYDLILDPGVDPAGLRVQYDGAMSMHIAPHGDLHIRTSVGEFIEERPVAFQWKNGVKAQVPVRFQLDKQGLGFVVGDYDPSLPLVIDPVVRMGSYIGGNDYDEGRGVTLDNDGNMYVTGVTHSQDFPSTTGSSLDTVNGSHDVFITKFDPTGRTLLWALYIGGDGYDDPLGGIRIASNNDVIVAGITLSTDFPHTANVVGEFNAGKSDGFVVALSQEPGTNGVSVGWSTYVGGVEEDSITAFDINPSGNILLSGTTISDDFPIPQGGLWPDLNGGSDAYVLELRSDGQAVIGGTYLGGTGNDYGKDIVEFRGTDVYVTGSTFSDNFPWSQNALQAFNAGGSDGFLVKLSADFLTLEYGTYIGGGGNDAPQSLALDTLGVPYLTGFTESTDFPVNINTTAPGGWFVTRIDPISGALDYSRYLTSESGDKGLVVKVDSSRRALLYGTTASLAFPIPNGIQSPGRGKEDLAFVRLSPDGNNIEQGSVIGGSEDDIGASHAWLSSKGDLYVTGRTRSANFPVNRFPFDAELNAEPGIPEPDAFLLAWSFNRRPNIAGPPFRTLDTLDCSVSTRDTFYLYNEGDDTLRIFANRFEDESVEFIYKIEEPALLPQPPIEVLPGDSIRYIVSFETRNVDGDENELLVFTSDSAFGKDPFSVSIRAARFAPSVLPIPSQVNFGNVLTCNDSTMILTLNNSSEDAITLEQPEFLAADGPFRLESDVLFPLTISRRGDPVEIRLTFSPDTVRLYTDTLALRVRECPENTQFVRITGRGEFVGLENFPEVIQFSELSSCATQADSVITVRNKGTRPLILRESDITGDGFQLVFPNGLPDTLDPGVERNLTVRFIADEEGGYNSMVRLSVSPCDTTFQLQLSGSRSATVAPSLSETDIDFGVLTFCNGEFAQKQIQLEITNSANSTLVLGTPVVTLPFNLCNPNFLTEVPPNSARSFQLCYTPVANDVDNGMLRIPYELNGCKDTLVAQLTGERERPELVSELDSISFAPLGTCEAFHDTIVVLRNVSELDETIDSVNVTRGVEMVSPSFPRTIPAGETVEVRLRFIPVTSGVSKERVRLYYSSRCADSLDMYVSGSADGLVIASEKERLELPTQLLCDPSVVKHDTIVIGWTGTTDENVSIQDLRLVGSDQHFAIENRAALLGSVIAEGERFPIPIRFRADAAGLYNDTLEIVTEPCLTVLRIPLSGEVVRPMLRISQANYGNVEVGVDDIINVVVANDSPVPLTLDTLSLGGAPFHADRTALEFPVEIPSGGALVVPVTFAPESIGEVQDSLVVVFSGDCDYRLTGMLSGTGIRSAIAVDFCVQGLYSEPRFVGDTANIFVEAGIDLELDSPVDILFYFQFDPMRFQFVGAVGGVVDSFDPLKGTVGVLVNGFSSIPADLPGVQLQLLGGEDLFALVSLDSVMLLNGESILPSRCDSSAIVTIVHRCFIEGVSFGKFPNRLERSAPNPANSMVEVTFQQLEDARTTLRVWNTEGREVLRPLEGFLRGGRYSVRFAVDELPPGQYFYSVQAGSWHDVGAMLIQR